MFDDLGVFVAGDLAAFLTGQTHYLESNPTKGTMGRNYPFICVELTQVCFLAAMTMRKWRPRLEEIHRDARQFVAGVRGEAWGR